jgi:hemerythrin superfamily protein
MPTRTKDAIDILKADHTKVRALFTKFESLKGKAPAQRQELVERISRELSVHSSVEELTFYPTVRERMSRSEDLVLESLEEHHLVKVTLSELEKMSPEDERYDAKMTVLIEQVKHHMREEEDDLFPRVRKHIPDADLVELAAVMREARATAPTRPHPKAPDQPPGNLAASLLSSPMDVAIRGTRAAMRRVAARNPLSR